jgi:hypothetical protein
LGFLHFITLHGLTSMTFRYPKEDVSRFAGLGVFLIVVGVVLGYYAIHIANVQSTRTAFIVAVLSIFMGVVQMGVAISLRSYSVLVGNDRIVITSAFVKPRTILFSVVAETEMYRAVDPIAFSSLDSVPRIMQQLPLDRELLTMKYS